MPDFANSFLKVKQRFVPVEEYPDELPDKNYIQGAICCRISDRDILTTEHWDLVDQLWCYILEGLAKVEHGAEYNSSFPDQPLRLRFRPLSPHAVEITIGDDVQRFSTESVVACLTQGAISFFGAMKRLAPEANDTWNRYETLAISLRKNLDTRFPAS
jgi:hypothetical protein